MKTTIKIKASAYSETIKITVQMETSDLTFEETKSAKRTLTNHLFDMLRAAQFHAENITIQK